MDAKKEIEYLTTFIRHLNGMKAAMTDYLEERKRELIILAEKAEDAHK